MTAAPYDAGNPPAVEDMEALARLARQQELDDLGALLAMPEGRRFLRRLLVATGPLTVSRACDPTAFHREGVRSVGLWVLAESMEADAAAAASLLAEYAVTKGVIDG